MIKIKVIGLSGLAGSGKDYVYQQYLFHKGWRQFSLAWHFKIWSIAAGIITYEEAFTNPKSDKVRTLLQIQGTELGRNLYGEDIWLQSVKAWTRTLSDTWGVNKFVVPDVRFHNELAFIKEEMGGVVFKVEAPAREAKSGLSEFQRAHSSEAEMMEMPAKVFDGVIYNDVIHESTVGKQVDDLLKLVNYDD